MLQFQSVMFTRSFPAMLAVSAQGNPAFIAAPISWSAALIGKHLAAANGTFAVVQLVLALGIAWRPTLKPALAASVAWALAVWWLGEGFGQVLAGTASPVSGAPGAVILYGLLAILLWPARDPRQAPFVAAGLIGARAARLIWLLLWGSLAYLAAQPAARAPGAVSGPLSDAASGQPAWIAWLDSLAASALAGQGLAVTVVLAAVLAIVAAGVFLAPRAFRVVIVLAVIVSALIWAAQGFGGIMSGAATDPDSGPLLALIAIAYWPMRAVPGRAGGAALRLTARSDRSDSDRSDSGRSDNGRSDNGRREIGRREIGPAPFAMDIRPAPVTMDIRPAPVTLGIGPAPVAREAGPAPVARDIRPAPMSMAAGRSLMSEGAKDARTDGARMDGVGTEGAGSGGGGGG